MLACLSSHAQWQDDAGRAQLLQYLGLNDLSEVNSQTEAVAMVEASPSGTYMPVAGLGTFTPTSGDYTALSFTNVTNTASGASSHASTVASRFFHPTLSLLPNLSLVHSYSAEGFVTDALKLNGTQITPLTGSVTSHAWIGNLNDPEVTATYADYLHRFDYLASSGNSLMVAGLNNGSSSTVPSLWGSSYNSISVGRISGNHSSGDTLTTYEDYSITGGRTKPDIVSNDSTTSYATGQVASGAGFLYGVANSSGLSNITENTHLQRAILLSGASKDRFISGWNNASTLATESRPLDPTWGAGELNIYNGYRIIESGQYNNSDSFYRSWDIAELDSTPVTYTLTIPEQASGAEVNITACWNRKITETAQGSFLSRTYTYSPEPLADVRLELSGGTLTSPIVCDSALDNVEHIHVPNLEPGTYTIQVSNKDGASSPASVAIAWRADLTEASPPNIEITDETLTVDNALPHVRYEILSSEDLETWTTIGEVTPTSPSIEWALPTSASTEQFYQLVYWP